MNLSKLLIAATFVSLFLPENSAGKFNPWTFAIGLSLSILSFMLSLTILPTSKI